MHTQSGLVRPATSSKSSTANSPPTGGQTPPKVRPEDTTPTIAPGKQSPVGDSDRGLTARKRAQYSLRDYQANSSSRNTWREPGDFCMGTLIRYIIRRWSTAGYTAGNWFAPPGSSSLERNYAMRLAALLLKSPFLRGPAPSACRSIAIGPPTTRHRRHHGLCHYTALFGEAIRVHTR
jgi:hypothetical protein